MNERMLAQMAMALVARNKGMKTVITPDEMNGVDAKNVLYTETDPITGGIALMIIPAEEAESKVKASQAVQLKKENHEKSGSTKDQADNKSTDCSPSKKG